MSELVTSKLPCDVCGSSDGLHLYDDGHGYCFACPDPKQAYRHPPKLANPFRGQGRDAVIHMPKDTKALIKASHPETGISTRFIKPETCKKYGYKVAKTDLGWQQVAEYRDKSGRIVGQKLRSVDKDFSWRGTSKNVLLYGQHLWNEGGKRLIITEGELDCLSVSQVQDNKWPVVSIQNGAQNAVKAITKQLTYVESFEKVVICFDNDPEGQGQKAAQGVAAILSPRKAHIAQLPLKDANEMLMAGRGPELLNCLWQAPQYRMDGVVEVSELREAALERPSMGLSWPWPSLTEISLGRRYGEIYTLGAGSGTGKTDVFTQTIAHTITENKERVGAIYLEQPPTETVRRVAGKMAGIQFHNPKVEWSPEQLTEQIDNLTDWLYLYDHFGGCEWDTVKDIIRYQALDKGCRHIFLDHLTALASTAYDEKKMLEQIMAEIKPLALSLNVCIYLISHLATPDGTPHEEGGRVMLRHFRGSRAIAFWSDFAFGLERNQQAEDEDERTLTTFRCLKDRLLGVGNGKKFGVRFDTSTGLLNEASLPEKQPQKPAKYGFDTTDDSSPF